MHTPTHCGFESRRLSQKKSLTSMDRMDRIMQKKSEKTERLRGRLRNAIFAECSSRGIDEETRHAVQADVCGVTGASLSTMTAGQMMAVLDRLKGKAARPRTTFGGGLGGQKAFMQQLVERVENGENRLWGFCVKRRLPANVVFMDGKTVRMCIGFLRACLAKQEGEEGREGREEEERRGRTGYAGDAKNAKGEDANDAKDANEESKKGTEGDEC